MASNRKRKKVSLLNKIYRFLFGIYKFFLNLFFQFCMMLSKAFFSLPLKLFMFIRKHSKNPKKWTKFVKHFRKRQKQPEILLLLILYVVFIYAFFNIYYSKNGDNVKLDDNPIVSKKDDSDVSSDDKAANSSETVIDNPKVDNNLYRSYSSTKLSDVDFSKLKEVSSNVVAWISVDGTSINYPVVQTDNNSYYLDHYINDKYSLNGWIFMDFRNSSDMSDDNTVIYGHNLLNKTAFGTLENLFTKKWLNKSNHEIVILTENKKYTYLIFSVYVSDPEVYYLQTDIYDEALREEFVNTIKSRSTVKLDTTVTKDDRIITLSTCTDGSTKRRVVHAKLINEQEIS